MCHLWSILHRRWSTKRRIPKRWPSNSRFQPPAASFSQSRNLFWSRNQITVILTLKTFSISRPTSKPIALTIPSLPNQKPRKRIRCLVERSPRKSWLRLPSRNPRAKQILEVREWTLLKWTKWRKFNSRICKCWIELNRKSRFIISRKWRRTRSSKSNSWKIYACTNRLPPGSKPRPPENGLPSAIWTGQQTR